MRNILIQSIKEARILKETCLSKAKLSIETNTIKRIILKIKLIFIKLNINYFTDYHSYSDKVFKIKNNKIIEY